MERKQERHPHRPLYAETLVSTITTVQLLLFPSHDTLGLGDDSPCGTTAINDMFGIYGVSLVQHMSSRLERGVGYVLGRGHRCLLLLLLLIEARTAFTPSRADFFSNRTARLPANLLARRLSSRAISL